MQRRRTVLSSLGRLGIGFVGMSAMTADAWAQRPARPIARPPRPDRPLVPGRFNPDTGGIAAGPLPGVFTVVAVDTQGDTLQLRDDSGRSGKVHVDPDLFDLESLKPGDQVEVDFLVPEPGATRLEAGGIWKVTR